MSRLDKSPGKGCWLWNRRKNVRTNYGAVVINGKQYRAHRVAYEILVGPIPAGLLVLHECDNPPCCRPSHLFLGTDLDNMRDKIAKGRAVHPRGEDHPAAKLTVADVLEIRKLGANGMRPSNIAPLFGVSYVTISHIIKRERWAHVP